MSAGGKESGEGEEVVGEWGCAVVSEVTRTLETE